MNNFTFLLISIFSLGGCIPVAQYNQLSPSYYAQYDIVLKEVEVPSDTEGVYAGSKIIRLEREEKTGYLFQDEMFEIIWLPIAYQLDFFLTNNTSRSMQIIWDEAVYINEFGISKRVIHNGVKYVDRNSSQPPAVIPRKATISDKIVPVDNVYYNSGQYGGWSYHPLFHVLGGDQVAVEGEAKKAVGKKVEVLLPIKIENTVREYIFIFLVEGYSIRKAIINEHGAEDILINEYSIE